MINLRPFRVWQRHLDVYRVTWKTNVVPPILEPIFYLLAFGAGIGSMVRTVSFEGESISYTSFIAPGLLATQVMFQSFFENAYGSFIRMTYQKTFDAMCTTPLTLNEILFGELLWGATKGLIGCLIMMIIISFFGLLHFPAALLVLLIALVSGVFFAATALCFTAKVASIDMFNFPIFLFVTPMFLFSGTFFPIEVLPKWAQYVAYALPLTHVTILMRQASLARFSAMGIWSFVYLAALTLPIVWVSVRLMKRRLVK